MTVDETPKKEEKIVPGKDGKFIIKDPAILDRVTGGASDADPDDDPDSVGVNINYKCPSSVE